MTHHFSVSDLGFRLIKAYEGFRGESRVLISGNNVVGYGHRIADQDIIALTKSEADVLLRKDIKPVEELVNDAVFAPLTQGQFDALCSLAYNIGPDAFIKSDVVKAINNGRPIEAANGFDVWRQGEVDGEVFMIDALVRRRTAEKALFLKPDRHVVTSPRDSLPPKPDGDMERFKADDLPVFTKKDADKYMSQIPYEQRPNPGRRREDGPVGVLELSEYYDDEGRDDLSPDIPSALELRLADSALKDAAEMDGKEPAKKDEIPSLTLSPIAEAAAEVSDRLEALIADQDKTSTDLSDMPTSLLKVDGSPRRAKVLPFRSKESGDNKAQPTEDGAPDGGDDAALTAQSTPPTSGLNDADNLDASQSMQSGDNAEKDRSSTFAFGVMMLSGLILFCLSLYANIKDPVTLLGAWGPVAVMAGLIMGGMIILGSIYYILKSAFTA